MKNIFESANLIQLQSLCHSARRIAILSHTNPDGDALGSGLALKEFLSAQSGPEEVRFFVPNRFPEFLRAIPGSEGVEVFQDSAQASYAFIADADLLICADFNQTDRLEKMSKAVEDNVIAPRILIDHHLHPPAFDLSFSDTSFSSTSHIVYELIRRWVGTEAITCDMAMALYVGIVTDTGNLSFGNLTPEVYEAVAVLVGKGVRPPEVSQAIFNTQSEHRLRMVGYLISEKMVVDCDRSMAYITLTRAEKERFHHQIGDTEGIVNMPLNIDCIRFSAMFIETMECIKISFRSQGDFDVNLFAKEHFNGGGHKNAAGGRFYGSMEEAVARFERLTRTNHP